MAEDQKSIILKRVMRWLLICLCSSLIAWAVLVAHAYFQESGLVHRGDLFQDLAIVILVCAMFWFVGITSQLAAAFDESRGGFSLYCLVFPFGPIAVYFYFRYRVLELLRSAGS